MSALTADRDTHKRAGEQYVWPVGAAKIIYKGAIVAINSGGYAIPGTDATNLHVVGRAEEYVDNSSGASGDENVETRYGTFRYAAATALDDDDLGKPVYVTDDQTINITGRTYNIRAGILVQREAAKDVWIQMTPEAICG